MPYVPRTKDARAKFRGSSPAPLRTVTLSCGCTTDAAPSISNPDRWYCCGGYQSKARGRTPRAPMVGNSHKRHGGFV